MEAIVLLNPKFPENLAGAVRAASAWEVGTVIWTGKRIDLEYTERIPRELRMLNKQYKDVDLIHSDRPLDLVAHLTPVCVEWMDSAQDLTMFRHPEEAVYVFGPEDGEVPQMYRRLCHSFVRIPTAHSINLAASINVMMYDRRMDGR